MGNLPLNPLPTDIEEAVRDLENETVKYNDVSRITNPQIDEITGIPARVRSFLEIKWELLTIPTMTPGWNKLVYGNGVLLLHHVDRSGTYTTATYLTSNDKGTTWQQRSFPITGRWAVAFGKGVFLAVRVDPATTQTVYTSTNGIDWALAQTANINGQASFGFLEYMNNHFILSGGTNNSLRFSADGISWQTMSFTNTIQGTVQSITAISNYAIILTTATAQNYWQYSGAFPATTASWVGGVFTNIKEVFYDGGKWWMSSPFRKTTAPGTALGSWADVDTVLASPTDTTFGHIAHEKGLYVVSGGSATAYINMVIFSIDGENFFLTKLPIPYRGANFASQPLRLRIIDSIVYGFGATNRLLRGTGWR